MKKFALSWLAFALVCAWGSTPAQASVTLTLVPSASSVALGGTLTLTATVSGTTNLGLTWSVNGVTNGNSTQGTLSSCTTVAPLTCKYTAPPVDVPSPNPVTFEIVSQASTSVTKTATATVTDSIAVGLTPSSASIALSGTQVFTATITGATSNAALLWYVNGVQNGNSTQGTLTSCTTSAPLTCKYTAPPVDVPSPNPAVIKVASSADPGKNKSANVTVTDPISVGLTPSSASIALGATQVFTATITGATSNAALLWYVNGVQNGNSTQGTLTACTTSAPLTCKYTAPPVDVPSPNPAVIKVASSADPGKNKSANLTVTDPIAVGLTPSSASIALGATQVFTATITGATSNAALLWYVNGVQNGNSTQGTLAACTTTAPLTCKYTAPPVDVPSPNPAVIKVASSADPGKNKSANLTVTDPIAVGLTPSSASIALSGTQVFTATITGATSNAALLWYVNGVLNGNSTQGTLTACTTSAPLTCKYTAPPVDVPSPNPAVIKVASSADPGKNKSANLTVTDPIAVGLTPSSASIALGGTQVFTATITGATSNAALNWYVNGVLNGNSTQGTLTSCTITAPLTCKYTAPAVDVPSPNPAVIKVASSADPGKNKSANVTVTDPIAVGLTPASASIALGATQVFTATITGATSNAALLWYVNGALNGNSTQGTLTACTTSAPLTCKYTAPPVDVPSPNPAVIKVASSADPGKNKSANLTVTDPIAVGLTPSSASIALSGTQVFTATITGATSNAALLWYVNGVLNGNSTQGTLTACTTSAPLTCKYTAPPVDVPSPNPAVIKVASSADPGKNKSANVTVTDSIAVGLTPSSASIALSGTQVFTATITGATSNAALLWYVNGVQNGNSTQGTLTSCTTTAPLTCKYTAPSVDVPSPNPAVIKVASSADPGKNKSANVTVTDNIAVTLSPSSESLAVDGTQEFTATISGTTNTALDWYVNGILKGNTTQGKLTACTTSAPWECTYTAPPVYAPDPNPAVIKVASAADPSKYKTASVKVTGAFSLTGSLHTARYAQLATLLNNGMVLIAGGTAASDQTSAELYNPSTGTFTSTGSLNTYRYTATATLLNDGMVLIAGGTSGPSAELYNSATGTFTYTTGNMNSVRYQQTATLLNNGMVLLAGGTNNTGPVASAELYNPTTETFTPTGSLKTARYQQTATLLNNGMVLLTGGIGSGDDALAGAELYNPVTGTFSSTTGSMTAAREYHTATLLNNGMVLVAGGYNGGFIDSAELYDPATGTFTLTGSLYEARDFATATLLNNGMVLVAGGIGTNSDVVLATAELYNPVTGTFTPTGSLNAGRSYHTATLLNSGMVLMAGGSGTTTGTGPNEYLASAELYEPAPLAPLDLESIEVTPATPTISQGTTQQFVATGTFSSGGPQQLASVMWSSSNTALAQINNDVSNHGKALAVAAGTVTIRAMAGNVSGSTTLTVRPTGFVDTGNMTTVRYDFTATTLPSGLVLMVGGYNGAGEVLATAELYNPSTGTFNATGSMHTARFFHSATLLQNGMVLVAGGCETSSPCGVASAELYNPANGTFSTTGSMTSARYTHTATLLPNGMVLIVGGSNSTTVSLDTAELFNPANGKFTATGSLKTARNLNSATLLANGLVLVAGGDSEGLSQVSAELYDPGTGEFTYTGNLGTARGHHAATLLANGMVLIAGGYDSLEATDLASAELYNPGTGAFTPTNNMNDAREFPTATLLNSGLVLVAGGNDAGNLATAELFNPKTGTFTSTGSMDTGRYQGTAVLLPNGIVLMAGGVGSSDLSSAELY